MTQGAPWKRIAEFAVPMLIGNFAQQLYNTADSVIVGRYVGDNALAAVGSATPILNFLLALFMGLSTGAGIVVSQSFGAKDRDKLSKNIGNCISLTFLFTIILMVFGPLITTPLLRLLDTPDTIINWCSSYLNIYFYGAIGFCFYNMLSGILRGMGDSFSALLYLLIAAGLNVVLDIVFVANFGLEVPGVSLATVLAQGISSVLCLFKLLRMRELFDLNLKTLKPIRSYSVNLLKIGIPSGLTQAIMSMALMVVQSLTNSMGEIVIACNTIIMRVDGFAMMPNMTFGQALSVYVGQNVGAGKTDRISKGVKQGVIMSVVFSAAITLVLVIFGRYLFSIFTTTTELITLAVRMMNILAVGYICVAVNQSFGGVMRGAGDTVTPMWITLLSSICFRVPLAYLLASLTRSAEYPHGSPLALYTSQLISWALGGVLAVVAFKIGKWRKKMRLSMNAASSGK